MIDYFALLEEARRPWLEPERLKEKYFARNRAAPADAELNEAFRVLSDPKLRLHHLLTLEGADLAAGRPVPPSVAELFWNAGRLLREVDHWLIRNAGATSALARSLLAAEKSRLETSLEQLGAQLLATFETELSELRLVDATWKVDAPNELTPLVRHYDSISYLGRLRERTAEKQFELTAA